MIRRGSSGFNNLLEQEARGIRADEFTPRERELLVNFMSHVVGAQSLDAVMTSCFQTLIGLGPVDRLELMLLDEDGKRLRLHWVRCKYEPVLLNSGQILHSGTGAAAKALEQDEEPYVVNDLDVFSEHEPEDNSSTYLKHEGLGSRLLWVLPGEKRPLGLLGLGSRDKYAFGYHQVQIIKTLGPRLAQAVGKAYQIEQLQAANRMYLESLGFISHELKNPLASMVMDARLLLQGYLGDLSEPQRVRLGKLTKKAEYMFSLIREYLDLARLETGELVARPQADVNLVETVIKHAVELASGHFDRYEVQLDLDLPDKPAPAMCDPELLVIAVVNLLSNAAKYGHESGKARVKLTQGEHNFTIGVWNAGEGFTEVQAQQLFHKFARLENEQTRRRKGNGVGLYTVQRIARLHGGDVQARSEPGQYAEFIISIPQPLICALPG